LHNNSLDVFSSADWLAEGKILLHPTEGVWGIGCDALNENSFLRVYELKKRPRNKSFILLIKSYKAVQKYIKNSEKIDLNFINTVWPGPTTLLVDYNDKTPDHLRNDSGKFALRVSNHYPITQLLKSFKGIMVSTSANISGKKNIDNAGELIKIFNQEDVGLYNDKLGNNIKPSRIIDLNSGTIIRD
jgi:L-threonylcarbamoyladenylate synthase